MVCIKWGTFCKLFPASGAKNEGQLAKIGILWGDETGLNDHGRHAALSRWWRVRDKVRDNCTQPLREGSNPSPTARSPLTELVRGLFYYIYSIMLIFLVTYIQVNIILGIFLGIYYWVKGDGPTDWASRILLVLFPVYGWGNWVYKRETKLGGIQSNKLKDAKIMIRFGVVNGFAIFFSLPALMRAMALGGIEDHADNSGEWLFNAGFNLGGMLVSGFTGLLLAGFLYTVFCWAPIIIGLIRQSSVYKNSNRDKASS